MSGPARRGPAPSPEAARSRPRPRPRAGLRSAVGGPGALRAAVPAAAAVLAALLAAAAGWNVRNTSEPSHAGRAPARTGAEQAGPDEPSSTPYALQQTEFVVGPGAWSPASGPHSAPRPPIVSREQWGADERLRHEPGEYAHAVRVVFVHHTDNPNDYDCAEVPSLLRAMYGDHATGRDWDDIGYNFLVDRCGTVYEGRAGGTDRPVVGAHAQGFNKGSAGIAAIGTFHEGTPVPAALTDAIARLVAWKLGLAGVDPRGRAALVSTNSMSRYRKGARAVFETVSGHRDGDPTDCPGAEMAERLPEIRQKAARLQGR
ncbi:peptidoglycan recognition protein family protein [Streptomyces sp. HB2AG]|uniref:peptidoglycan recognition protein family protein n=1 Tax=Streptomyces sp. HB2AG TaxID=2983400 RepID=UPI0022AB0112|nr:peptidoglycan recognition protein [Streptomyces sp. HB2AG]MCZ2523519.1 peptidoglycan recognition protein [Streptomyces sp. HB2AG]